MQNNTALRGGTCLCVSGAVNTRAAFILAGIRSRLMVSECDRPIAVNLRQMKCTAAPSSVLSDGMMSLGSGWKNEFY